MTCGDVTGVPAGAFGFGGVGVFERAALSSLAVRASQGDGVAAPGIQGDRAYRPLPGLCKTVLTEIKAGRR
jgi:hypothetical protein